MQAIEALSQLMDLKVAFFKTADAAACWKVSRSHASKILARLGEAGQVRSLTRSVWTCSKSGDLIEAVSQISAPWPSYISLQTALFHHGMISQIPATLYAMTLGRTRKVNTSIGRISFHHVSSQFFFGFEAWGTKSILMATSEKALADILYLKPARSRLFQALPELTLPTGFSRSRAIAMIQKIPSERRRTLVKKQFEKIL